MKKTIALLIVLSMVCAVGIMTASTAFAEQIPLTLELLEAGFDLDSEKAQHVEMTSGTNAMTLARSQLDAALTFELTLLTNIPADPELAYAPSYFQVRDYTRIQSRKSLTTRETEAGTFYAWRVTVPTLALLGLADHGVYRYALSFVEVDKPLASGDTLALEAPYTIVLHYLEDRSDVLETIQTVYGTFRIGSQATITGVRESVNVRVLPHDKSASVGRAYLTEVVQLLDWDNTGAWVRIRYQNLREGWVPFVNVTLLDRP